VSSPSRRRTTLSLSRFACVSSLFSQQRLALAGHQLVTRYAKNFDRPCVRPEPPSVAPRGVVGDGLPLRRQERPAHAMGDRPQRAACAPPRAKDHLPDRASDPWEVVGADEAVDPAARSAAGAASTRELLQTHNLAGRDGEGRMEPDHQRPHPMLCSRRLDRDWGVPVSHRAREIAAIDGDDKACRWLWLLRSDSRSYERSRSHERRSAVAPVDARPRGEA